MRIAVMIAASVLLAGCSNAVSGDAERSEPTLSVPPGTTRSTTSVPTTTSTVPSQPPGIGAPIGEVIAWVEAGTSADASGFHTATREGVTTQLGDDVAFTTPSGTSNCMTDTRFAGGALACLVDLSNPPPRPAEVYGEWKGGWVDFTGPTLEVGSAHGDPGRFSNGTGPALRYGQTLAFGDYRCRADPAGLFCVNYAHQSGVRFSDAGVELFGCLQRVDPPPDIGDKFSC
jgi:hypothetical protein